MKKRRIVIASVLKPVDDTRMFEKLGATLSSSYDVHIVGFNSRRPPESSADSLIAFHGLGIFARISVARLLAPWRFLRIARALEPDLVIVCTHELLIAAMILKIITRCKVIYDVQENYARNIYHGNTVPILIKLPLAAYLRTKEWILSPAIDHFFLAERSYAAALTFTKHKNTILENKVNGTAMPSTARKQSFKDTITLLFSGTLADTTGVFTAIALATRLHGLDQRIHLHVIGYASQLTTREEIQKAVAGKPYIRISGLTTLVPHAEILSAIRECDFGIISYPPNPATKDALPTKLFEYMGYRLPILMVNNNLWVDYCAPYPAAIQFDPESINATDLLHKMQHTTFYTTPPADVYWESEEPRLMEVMRKIMNLPAGKGRS